jgi:hypothetical protein
MENILGESRLKTMINNEDSIETIDIIENEVDISFQTISETIFDFSFIDEFFHILDSQEDENILINEPFPLENESYEEEKEEEKFINLIVKEKDEDIEEKMECGVCLNDEIKMEKSSLLNCGHKFCNSCIQTQVLKNFVKCGFCRKEIKSVCIYKSCLEEFDKKKFAILFDVII